MHSSFGLILFYLLEINRTDNAIKNHWNCIVKKKLDSDSPACAEDLHKVASLNFCSCAMKTESKEVKEERQNPDELVSVHGRMGLKCSADTGASKLLCRLVNGEQNQLEAKHGATFKTSVGMDELMNGIHFSDVGANGSVAMIESGRNNSKHDILNSSMELRFDVSASTRPCCSALDAAVPFTLNSTKSPNRLRGHEFCILHSEFENKTESSLSYTSTSATGEDKSVTEKEGKFPKLNVHMQSVDSNEQRLHHESAHPKDLVTDLDGAQPSIIHHHVLHANSPFSCSTPSNCARYAFVSVNSPESILRNSARTFKNTPSIIRKRAYKEAGVDKSSDVASTPSWKISCTNSTSEDINNADIPNGKQGCLSFFCKPGSSLAVKSLRRQLDYAFEMERDAAAAKCGNPFPATASPNIEFFSNAMVIP